VHAEQHGHLRHVVGYLMLVTHIMAIDPEGETTIIEHDEIKGGLLFVAQTKKSCASLMKRSL